MIRKTLFPLLLLSTPLGAVPVFIGTNTGGNSTSKGIYLADFDPETGKLTVPELAAEYKNPGFLALHSSKPVLYASGKPNEAFDDESDSVAAFAIGEKNALTFLGETSTGGKGACHVAVDRTGSTAAVANYWDGTYATIQLDEKGTPVKIASFVKTEGSGPNKQRQDQAHAHGVYFSQNNRFFFMPDLGIDGVIVHSFDPATSKLGKTLPQLKTKPGAGPRHIAFSPDEKHVYVVNELDNTVLAATYSEGKFEKLDTVPTLPADFEGHSTTSEIEVHPNGKFVYASNRGHDSITVFSRDTESGKLTFVQHAPCGGKTPRHFKIDPTGKWLLCGNQDSNTVSVHSLDTETGKLGKASEPVASPSPICILFVP